MDLIDIPPDRLQVRPHHLWGEQWLLLAAGDLAQKRWNAMTVAWGSFGTMWERPMAQIVVRPGRYTHGFTEAFPTFTLCAFPERHRTALALLGKKSGRDGDKVAEAGLTPVPAAGVAAPAFAEAELVVSCRTMYRSAVDPAGFRDAAIAGYYPERDHHTIYFGEIVAVRGVAAYRG